MPASSASSALRRAGAAALSWTPFQRASGWKRTGVTLVFSVVVAVAFTLIGYPLAAQSPEALASPAGWWQWFELCLSISAVIGFMIQGMFQFVWKIVGTERMRALAPWQQTLLHGGISVVAVVVGIPLGRRLAPTSSALQMVVPNDPRSVVSSIALSVLITGIFILLFAARNRRVEAERRATEAQLKLLQGQIEPHFLFNTLANVVGLMDYDTPRAKLMLEAFVDYLRSSFGSLRREMHTLGDELVLVESYLKIVQIRMDDRLSYSIDVPADLRAAPLPALTLQPLVENAILHGLEPKIEGGRVRISARRDARGLSVTVEDDGLGLQAARPSTTRSTGSACRNIRERLQQIHGDAARLDIEPALPTGVLSRLTLP